MPFKAGEFDFVFETSLCHVAEKQVARAVRELNRVMKTGLMFGSVTSDMAPALIDRYDLLRGVKKLATWWEWSELFFGNGFDLSMHRRDCTDAVWAATLAANKGPGQWYADADSLQTALGLADGIAVAEWANVAEGEKEPRRLTFSEKFACPVSGFTISEIEPRLFSFNNPFGACPACHGFGNIIELDMDLVVPDATKSINQGAIEPWSKPHYRAQLAELGVVVPLVACLLALSAWPAAVSGHSFRSDHPTADVTAQFR